MSLLWGFSVTTLAFVVFSGQVDAQSPSEHASSYGLPSKLGIHAVEEAFAVADRETQRERKEYTQGRITTRRGPQDEEDIPGSRHDSMLACGAGARHLERVQRRYETASKYLITSYNLSAEQVRSGLSGLEPRRADEECRADVDSGCEFGSRFRTLDGSCNNLRHPRWGMAPSCYRRLVDSAYEDGLSEKRTRAKSGRALPLARTVSLRLHNHLDKLNENVTAMFMMWGQFLGHDVTLTPVTLGPNGEKLKCCPLSAGADPQCDPVIIPRDDPFFGKLRVTCLHNVRSAPCGTCSLGPRAQINQETAFLDASHLYGPGINISNSLRNFDGTGTLRTIQTPSGGELLSPSSNPEVDLCSFQHESLDCFQSGDPRVNSHPALTAMHTLFAREHNRVARALAAANPHWGEERLFQEARRIVIAQLQLITYAEFLPLLLGPDRMRLYDLATPPSGRTTYDPAARPDVLIEFNSAAFRLGHSMIPGFFSVFRESGASGYWLKDRFFYPFELHNGMLEGLIAGLFSSLPEHVDNHVVSDVTDHLYKTRDSDSGLDLAAININRGRDHGIPPYTTLLRHCTGRTVAGWGDLEGLLQEEGLVGRLKGVYDLQKKRTDLYGPMWSVYMDCKRLTTKIY